MNQIKPRSTYSLIARASLLAIFSVFYFCSYSQSEVLGDTSFYYRNLDNYINLSIDLETDFENFRLEGDDFLYDIRPNYSYLNLVGIDYRALSFFLSFKPALSQNLDEDLKGSTNVNGFGFSFNTSKLINHLSWKTTTGYYLENSIDYVPNFIDGETAFIQFPELNYTSYRGTHYYKFNPNFSYAAFNVQMAQQLKSAGSFATGVSWNYGLIENDTPQGQSSNNLQVLFDLAYYHSFIFQKKWYVNLGLINGAGFRFTNLTTPINGTEEKSDYTSFTFRAMGIIGAGYNSRKMFGGIDLRYRHEVQEQGAGRVHEEWDGYSFRAFIGVHILAPKFINKTYDKVETFFGI